MRKWILPLLLFHFMMFSTGAAADAESKALTISVKSSPNAGYVTTLQIRGKKMLHRLEKRIEEPTKQPLPLTDMYMALGDKNLILDRKGNVYDLKNGKRLWLPRDLEQQLLTDARLLRKQHYGKLLPWEKVDKIIPKKAKFTVMDLETGKTFQVQRRAGHSHADVQPLTEEDTKIMKDIYDGHWSWRRRAILVKADGRTIAASMHGMPHGAGALQNGFPGHFCIHFFGSTTHRSEKVDPSHEVMVYQAAGQLYNYLENATPYEVVDAFFVAMNQHNEQLLKMTLSRENHKETKKLMKLLDQVEAINNTSSLKEEDTYTSFGVNIPVDVRIYWRGSGVKKDSLSFLVMRNAPGERWRIDTESLLKSLE
ncbi:MAG TPA: hypothetical protein VFK33_06370 [Bacillales bacterium]|nr:hypothetical protein [Bacillales bacterium]